MVAGLPSSGEPRRRLGHAVMAPLSRSCDMEERRRRLSYDGNCCIISWRARQLLSLSSLMS